jgi:hypothetical protein
MSQTTPFVVRTDWHATFACLTCGPVLRLKNNVWPGRRNPLKRRGVSAHALERRRLRSHALLQAVSRRLGASYDIVRGGWKFVERGTVNARTCSRCSSRSGSNPRRC